MTPIDPSWSHAPGLALEAGLALAVGALLGAIHLATLRYNVGLFAVGSSALWPIALLALRLAVLGAALAAIVLLFGALALLLAFAGFLAARTALLRRGSG